MDSPEWEKLCLRVHEHRIYCGLLTSKDNPISVSRHFEHPWTKPRVGWYCWYERKLDGQDHRLHSRQETSWGLPLGQKIGPKGFEMYHCARKTILTVLLWTSHYMCNPRNRLTDSRRHSFQSVREPYRREIPYTKGNNDWILLAHHEAWRLGLCSNIWQMSRIRTNESLARKIT